MILNLLPLVLLLPPVSLLPLVSAIILKTAFIAFCYFELFHFAVNLLLLRFFSSWRNLLIILS